MHRIATETQKGTFYFSRFLVGKVVEEMVQDEFLRTFLPASHDHQRERAESRGVQQVPQFISVGPSLTK